MAVCQWLLIVVAMVYVVRGCSRHAIITYISQLSLEAALWKFPIMVCKEMSNVSNRQPHPAIQEFKYFPHHRSVRLLFLQSYLTVSRRYTRIAQ
jgi:hypothetical protein